MKRDINRLTSQPFDAVIVGGGIHGATAYHQLAKQGLRCAIIEKDDFGQATSANSLKILHGGLRYLQHLNFSRMRESIKSRWHYMDIAPHLIKPMPCLMATKGMGIQSKPIMAIALALFDLIAWDRNRNVPAVNRVGRGKVISKKEILKIAPGINSQELTGAALWYDDLILNTERMTLAFVLEGSDKYQGVAANYVKALEIVKDGTKVVGIQALDQISGEKIFIDSRIIINAAGPWAGTIESPAKPTSTPEDLAKAVNIVINRPLFKGYGMGLSSKSGYVDKDAVVKRGSRLFFFAPWKDATIIGTTYRYYRQNNDFLKVTQSDIDELIEEVNGIYPRAKLTREDVTFSHCGLVPAHRGINFDYNTTPQMIKHSRIIDHQETDSLTGLYTIEGVKYTTAPEIARQLAELLKGKDELKNLCKGEEFSQQHRKVCISEAGIKRMDQQYPHIAENYGKDSGAIYQIMKDVPGTDTMLLHDPKITKAEVIHSVEQEMAVCLKDMVLRRTSVATTVCPDKEGLTAIAQTMGELLGWGELRVDDEVESVFDHFTEILGIQSVNQ